MDSPFNITIVPTGRTKHIGPKQFHEDVFKPSKADFGKTYFIRPIIDFSDTRNMIKTVPFLDTNGRPWNKFYCYALVDGHLKVFCFGRSVLDSMIERDSGKVLIGDSTALKLTVDTAGYIGGFDTYAKFVCEIISAPTVTKEMMMDIKKRWDMFPITVQDVIDYDLARHNEWLEDTKKRNYVENNKNLEITIGIK